MQDKISLNNIKDYIIVVQHPVTTEYTETKKQIKSTIDAVSKLNIQTIWLWPNVDLDQILFQKS